MLSHIYGYICQVLRYCSTTVKENHLLIDRLMFSSWTLQDIVANLVISYMGRRCKSFIIIKVKLWKNINKTISWHYISNGIVNCVLFPVNFFPMTSAQHSYEVKFQKNDLVQLHLVPVTFFILKEIMICFNIFFKNIITEDWMKKNKRKFRTTIFIDRFLIFRSDVNTFFAFHSPYVVERSCLFSPLSFFIFIDIQTWLSRFNRVFNVASKILTISCFVR